MSEPYVMWHLVLLNTGSAILCGNSSGQWIVADFRTTKEELVEKGVCEACARVLFAMKVDHALEGPYSLLETQKLGYRAGLTAEDIARLRKKVLP